MDTRKLLAALTLTSFSFSLPAQDLYALQTTTPATLCTTTKTTALLTNDVEVYRNADGTPVIKWNAAGTADLEYLLQGSIDGKAFRLIKKVTATAFAAPIRQYEATDDTGKGYAHFRIIRIAQSGEVSYSKTVSAP